MANSVLTLKLFVEHNYTDIAGLTNFTPVFEADGKKSYRDLEFGDTGSSYAIRFAAFE